ncbi:DUF6531 domain-containing protein [Microbulbifer celer]|uniref:DUF6531 domain-containing protein n=1 Tax=Microbulbifer celer TaxID=435905 RepID=A0ABW3U8K3_9GAMM|nr:DUF6531 domain-containing protein [Microbulbifer celer]UFN56783.1 DUF6531 domain-containing protein [Microbulbifer celer]
MTPDRLVDFVPSVLNQLSTNGRLPEHRDSISLCQWFNLQDPQSGTSTPVTPHQDLWPDCPGVSATNYTLARAPRVDSLILPSEMPVLFCNQPGSSPDGQTIPSLDKSVHIANHVLACNGRLVFSRSDFQLPGPIPFIWQRFYRQGEERDCGLGVGWRHTLSEVLELPDSGASNQQALLLHTAEGRQVYFDLPPIGHGIYNRCEKLLLVRQSLHSFRLCGFNTPDKVFRADGASGLARLNEIRDHFGNTLTVDYQGGQPQKIVTSWGRTLQFHYNPATAGEAARLRAISHSPSPRDAQEICRYVYEEQVFEGIEKSDAGTRRNPDSENAQPTPWARLISAESDSLTEHYQYSGSFLTGIQRRSGERWHFSFDRQSRCNHIEHNERVIQLRWQQARQRCTQSVTGEHSTSWQFDGRNNLLRQQQAEREYRYLYDHYNNLCSQVAPDGKRDLYRYDELGRLTRHTRNGVHRRFVFDALGRLCGVQVSGAPDISGNSTWRFVYGDHPHPESIVDPRSNRWLCEYDERGQLRLLTDPEGGQVSLQWDAQAQLQAIHRGSCNWQFSYDHWHRLTHFKSADGREESWQYQNSGSLQQAHLADGTYSIEYDEVQRPIRIHMDNQLFAQWRYDEYGRVCSIVLPRSPQWLLEYQPGGQLCQLQVGEQRYHWQFDAFAQTSLLTDSSGREIEWQYNCRGQVTEYRDCDNHWYLHYDACGQLQKIRNNSGQQCDFHFDHYGRLTQAANQHGSLRFRYDESGLLIAEHHDIREGENLSINHQYDSRGWLKTSGSDRLNITCLFSPDANLFGLDANGEPVLRSEQKEDHWIWNLGRLSLHRTFQQGRLESVSWGSEPENARSFVQERREPSTPLQFLPINSETHRDRRGYIERENRHSRKHPAQATDNALGNQHIYHYQFDGWGLLSSAECGDFKTYFRYDPFGRRLWKTSTHRRSARQRRVLTHWWSLGLWSTTTIQDEQEMRTHYLHHPQLATPLARIRAGSPEYFIADDNASIQGLADGEGNVFWLAGNQGTQCPDEYRGDTQIVDSETRLHYVGFRYWHPGRRVYLDAPPTQLRWDMPAVATGQNATEQGATAQRNPTSIATAPIAVL